MSGGGTARPIRVRSAPIMLPRPGAVEHSLGRRESPPPRSRVEAGGHWLVRGVRPCYDAAPEANLSYEQPRTGNLASRKERI